MSRGLYITADTISADAQTGGGQVAYHEFMALGKACGEAFAATGDSLKPGPYSGLDVPFLQDYFCQADFVNKPEKFDIAHIYSGTFPETVKALRKRGTWVSYTSPAHNRFTTMDEFKRVGAAYPYVHISDDALWQRNVSGMREADLVIAPSKHSAEFLADQGCKRITIIPHGCDLPERQWNLPSEWRAGFLGQCFGIDKGLRYLIAAWGKLAYLDATLVLAGPCSDELAPMIRSLAPAGKFHLMGFVPDKEGFYKNICCFVEPSTTEAFGIGVLESMARGRYVVTTEGVGASDVSRLANNPVVPIRDVDKLAEAIDYIKKSFSEVDECGPALIERDYAWPVIRERYVGIWQGVLGHS